MSGVASEQCLNFSGRHLYLPILFELGAELSAALGHCASRLRFCGRQKSVKSAERECIFNYPIFRALGPLFALLFHLPSNSNMAPTTDETT
jgi:hypothetical protein